MGTLFLFLGCIVLLPFALLVIGHIILPGLWKLKYIILGLTVPFWIWLIWMLSGSSFGH